jgi:hypothetical protein
VTPLSSKRGTIKAQAKALRLRRARPLAEAALKNPYSVAGRGSVLEADLARTVLDLLEEHRAE